MEGGTCMPAYSQSKYMLCMLTSHTPDWLVGHTEQQSPAVLSIVCSRAPKAIKLCCQSGFAVPNNAATVYVTFHLVLAPRQGVRHRVFATYPTAHTSTALLDFVFPHPLFCAYSRAMAEALSRSIEIW